MTTPVTTSHPRDRTTLGIGMGTVSGVNVPTAGRLGTVMAMAFRDPGQAGGSAPLFRHGRHGLDQSNEFINGAAEQLF
jgi:hypothetical protein